MLRLADRPVVQLGLALERATRGIPLSEEGRAVQEIVREWGEFVRECRVPIESAAHSLIREIREAEADIMGTVEAVRKGLIQ